MCIKLLLPLGCTYVVCQCISAKVAFLPAEKELKETGLKNSSSADEGLGVSCVLWTVPILSNHCGCLQVLQYNTNTENFPFTVHSYKGTQVK